ncbi:MAG: hypothetical protein JWM10_348 [Myxococcaceae bacterium]|nr:hypothetical protein [Myxococcaceae bacterium]
MSQAIFSTNVSYTPGGGGALTQSFNGVAPYNAINAGSYDLAHMGTTTNFTIAFGGVGIARGFIVRNNTGNPIHLFLNNPITSFSSFPANDLTHPHQYEDAYAAAGGFQLPPGGVLTLCFPTAPSSMGPSSPLGALAKVTVILANPGGMGTIDYIVLGD